jgi:signal transduction histidine kinase
LSDEAQKLMQHLDSSLRSAEDLISDLLDISRLENGKIQPGSRRSRSMSCSTPSVPNSRHWRRSRA